eukprot:TRINITY_DN920_c0_g1_i7.p1 TRINITY_DN920_c0_g1~~TRINITY_DN920_c0_g1_i7.p1  ORF type:complete len:100 (+),score=34.74 TRINITY_DN920_c0_g1_i7:325-624(+)
MSIGVHGFTTFILSIFGFTTFIGVHEDFLDVVVVVLNTIVTGCIIGMFGIVVWTEIGCVGTGTCTCTGAGAGTGTGAGAGSGDEETESEVDGIVIGVVL